MSVKRRRRKLDLPEDVVAVDRKVYFERLEALDYIARYDIDRVTCCFADVTLRHLRDTARKALGRK